MKIVLLALLFTSQTWAGAVDDCINSIGQGKIDCSVKASLPSNPDGSSQVSLCQENGNSCGYFCSRNSEGTCQVEKVVASALAQSCINSKDLNAEEQRVCESKEVLQAIWEL